MQRHLIAALAVTLSFGAASAQGTSTAPGSSAVTLSEDSRGV
jgi:hypothetical protein